MHLLIATTNPGKLRDFAASTIPGLTIEPLPDLANLPTPGLTIEPLPDLANLPTPEEHGTTFAENAIAKATAYSLHAPGQIVLADDSGLEVDALNGAPGVRSARFADDRNFTTRASLPTDPRNNLCLLDALAATREADRTARYRCVLAAARDGHILATGEGTVEGEILAFGRGNAGFGYDPLFLLPEEGLSMGELVPTERLNHSHRGRALQDLLSKLLTSGS